MAEPTADSLRNALEIIRLKATLDYMGQAFDPIHMRSIANIAIRALNGVPIPPLPPPPTKEELREKWGYLLEDLLEDDHAK